MSKLKIRARSNEREETRAGKVEIWLENNNHPTFKLHEFEVARGDKKSEELAGRFFKIGCKFRRLKVKPAQNIYDFFFEVVESIEEIINHPTREELDREYEEYLANREIPPCGNEFWDCGADCHYYCEYYSAK